MKDLQLAPEYLQIVKQVLKKNIPRRQVCAFGSRVMQNARVSSDLDLCVLGQRPLSLKQMGVLREAFSESALPMRIDIVNWSTLSPTFQTIIKKNAVKL